jgi:integrase
MVRDIKGKESRVTPLPDQLMEPLTQHLQQVKRWHQMDLNQGYGAVALPYALVRKYVNANRQWVWQFVFPAKSRYRDQYSEQMVRPHLHPSGVQKALKQAVGASGMQKRVSCHSCLPEPRSHFLDPQP